VDEALASANIVSLVFGTHPKAGKLLVKFSTDFLLVLKKDLDIVKESSKYTHRRCCYH
jgi:hypothetical protein